MSKTQQARSPIIDAGEGENLIESRHVWILKPSPENTELYRDDEASLREFAEHVRRDGILEPLAVTADDFVVSGHRRLAAARLAGLSEVPCRVLKLKRADLPTAEYVKLLRECNRQRSKSIDEILRESVVDADPDAAYTCLVESRVKRARNGASEFEIEGTKHRATISKAKQPMLAAAMGAIEEREEFHPLTVRQVHYCLLSDPPLRHASKPDSRYRNDRASYADLCDLLARARIAGDLPWSTIADETRPVKVWRTYRNVGAFTEDELSGLFGNYWRDLLQSQPDHHEILIEKSASLSVIEQVAMKYTIPVTSGRGQCSKVRLWEMARRFQKSKKQRLVLLLLSDFDPAGDYIANATAQSLRDDLSVDEDRLVAVRVALRPDQIERFNLPHSLELKGEDVVREKFIARHGLNYAVELEALRPEHLQDELDKAIRGHIDVDLFNREVQREKEEAAKLQGLKAQVLSFVGKEGLT
jgi:hypothetical protein